MAREHDDTDAAPGDANEGRPDIAETIRSYLIGFALALVLTAASFAMVGTSLVYGPGVPVAMLVLAVAQMGVHLVFFLHITTGPDNTNNVLALAFGVLIVGLVVIGSMWIMSNLNENMIRMDQMMKHMNREG